MKLLPYILLLPCLMSSASAQDPKPAEDPQVLYRQLNTFGEAYERIREGYVDKVGDDKLVEAAIGGMLSSLDPHSSYLNEKNFADMKVQTKGAFGGLGIEITQENGLIRIITPIDDTPAARAGMKAGDLITHIGNEAVLNLTLEDALEKMRGAPGTAVTLTVRRASEKEPRKFTLTREIIQIKSVRAKLFGKIGYIRISQFSENTESGLTEALNRFRKSGANAYVIDLRNDPGGLLDQAVKVADAFLDRGVIVSTRGRDDREVQRFEAEKGDLTDGAPVAVLINAGSASASEIVAGALQDHKRAVVLGVKSFGKGSVQTILPLKSGAGALRMTTARYYTPSGNSIQAQGITPDIEVLQGTFSATETASGLSENSLHGHLANPTTGAGLAPPPELKGKEGDKPAAKEADKAPDKASGNKEADKPAADAASPDDADTDAKISDPKTDYQLNYALNMMRAVVVATDKEAPRGAAPAPAPEEKSAAKPEKKKPAHKPAP